MKLLTFIKKFNREESGQDAVEYALVMVAIGGAVFGASTGLATALSGVFTTLEGDFVTWGV